MKKPKETKINTKQGYGLFNELGNSRLKVLFSKLFPTATISERGPLALLMNCPHPNHKDNHPSFYVYTAKNYCRCFACGYYTTNLLELIQVCKSTTLRDAAQQIQLHTNYKFLSEKVEKMMDEIDVHQKATLAIFYATNQYLQNILDPPADDYEYSKANLEFVKPTIDWLIKERKLNKDWVPYLPMGVMPPRHILDSLIEEYLEAKRQKEYEDFETTTYTKEKCVKINTRIDVLLNSLDTSWLGSVCFHTGYSLTTPGRIKLRRPDKDKTDNIRILDGFTEDDALGFVGLYNPYFNHFTMRELKEFTFILVEGEFDMLIPQQEELQSGNSNIFYIAKGGNANNSDDLFLAGITKVHIISDHYDPEIGKGDEWLMNTLQSVQELEARIFSRKAWDELRTDNQLLKDPDDVVTELGYEHFRNIVFNKKNESFIPLDIWACERAIEEGLAVPSTEILLRTNIARDFGQCVRHPALLGVYVEKVSAALGISAVALRSEIVKAKETEAGYILRIADFLKNEFHLLYKTDNNKGGSIRMYHKRTKRFVDCNINDGESMLTVFSNIFGDMFLYFKDFIGLPPWRSDANLDALGNTPLIRDTLKEIATYLRIAMFSVFKGVPSKEECIIIGQGIHYLEDPFIEAKECLYINNGKRVFKVWEDQTSGKIDGVELSGPSDGDYLFEPSEEWSKVIKNIDTILECNNVDIKDLDCGLNQIYNFISKSWKFKFHELDSMFITYHLAACAMHYMFNIKTIVNFLGPTQSGKSTVMSLFSGQYPHLQLVELCYYMSDYTKASVYQTFSNSTLCAILEEFSIDYGNNNGHKSNQVKDISELIRSNLFERGAVIRRGSTTGASMQYKMRTNILLTSINLPDDTQDINRRYEIETVRSEDIKDPAITIFNHIDKSTFNGLRKLFTVGFIKYAFKLKKIHDELNEKFNNSDFLPFHVQSRFLRNLIPISAIMSLLGKDWYQFVHDVCSVRKGRLAAVSKSTVTSALFERILRTAVIPAENGKRYSIINLIADNDKVSALNSSGCGVYFNAQKKYICIDWICITSPNGVLNKVEEFSKMPGHALKHVMDQHNLAIKNVDYVEKGVFEFLKLHNLIIEEHEISVISVEDMIKLLPAPVALPEPNQDALDRKGNTSNTI